MQSASYELNSQNPQKEINKREERINTILNIMKISTLTHTEEFFLIPNQF